MANPFYNASGSPARGSDGLSAVIRAEFLALQTAFDQMPRITTTGVFDTVFNQLGNFTFTLPSAPGTIATTANVATETTRATAAEAANATAITAEATARAAAVTAETTRATTAEALLAPKASPTFTGTVTLPALTLGSTPIILGTAIGDVPGPLVNFQGSGFPGLLLTGRLVLAQASPVATDFAVLQIKRDTSFTGGSAIASILHVDGTIGANDTNRNWGVVSAPSTNAVSGGLVGGFFQATRNPGAGAVIIAGVSDAIDTNITTSSLSGAQLVGHEVDVECFRADDGTNPAAFGGTGIRVAINVVGFRHASSDANQATIARGLWFSTGTLPLVPGAGADSLTNYLSLISAGVNVQTQSVIDSRGAIPPAGSSNPVNAVTMTAGHVIDFNGGASLTSAPGRYLSYNSGGTRLQYLVSGTERFSISDAGNALVAGTLGVTGNTTLSGTLGAGASTLASLGVTGAATAASFTGPTIGTTTNDNAAAGQVGEVIASTVLVGSAVSTGTSLSTHNVTSISLTAGDWDVHGAVTFHLGLSAPTGLQAAIGLVSNSSPVVPSVGTVNCVAPPPSIGTENFVTAGTCRISLASTTTVYLTETAVWPSGTGPTAYGFIEARRAR